MPDVSLYRGDSAVVLRGFDDDTFDSVVTDPPYGLSKEPDIAEVLTHWLAGDDYEHTASGFMGKSWDSFVPGPALWREVYRVMKPGAHLLAFSGARTVDLMGIALRLAGFEIRDEIMWLYGQGWPKGQDVGRALVKEGNPLADDWTGWNTQLKPAHEPVILCRKPLVAKVTTNVSTLGTGALNIDGCRIDAPEGRPLIEADYKATDSNVYAGRMNDSLQGGSKNSGSTTLGRFPTNVVMSHTDECSDNACSLWCPVDALDRQSGTLTSGGPGVRSSRGAVNSSAAYGAESRPAGGEVQAYGDSGGASRFFYCSKSPKSERNAGLPPGETNQHPTVKPLALMEYLIRLVTPPGGLVLDPFVGSGTTALAATRGGFRAVGVDRDDEDRYLSWAEQRIRTFGVDVERF